MLMSAVDSGGLCSSEAGVLVLIPKQMQDVELEKVFPDCSRLLMKEEMKASGKSEAAGRRQE